MRIAVIETALFMCLFSCTNTVDALGEQPFSYDQETIADNVTEQDPDDPRDFHADVTFSIIERKAILQMLARLSKKTGYKITVTFDRPHRPTDDAGEFFPGERKVIFRTHGEGGNYSGSQLRIIRIGSQKITNAGQTAWVVTHEMGHDFGMKHVSDRGSMMSKYFYPEDDKWNWTDLDQAECERIGVCTPIGSPAR